jgi:hypothetical protein
LLIDGNDTIFQQTGSGGRFNTYSIKSKIKGFMIGDSGEFVNVSVKYFDRVN